MVTKVDQNPAKSVRMLIQCLHEIQENNLGNIELV